MSRGKCIECFVLVKQNVLQFVTKFSTKQRKLLQHPCFRFILFFRANIIHQQNGGLTVNTGTMLMTERRSRKGIGTPQSLIGDAEKIEELAKDLRAFATVMKSGSVRSFEIDGNSKLDRGLSLIRQYVQRVDEGIAVAMIKRKYRDSD